MIPFPKSSYIKLTPSFLHLHSSLLIRRKTYMNQKYLLTLPLCSLLLLGAGPQQASGVPLTSINISTYTVAHKNALDYFVISAVKKDTPTTFLYCFSTSSISNISIDIYYVDTKSSTETLILSDSVRKSQELKGTLSYIEPNPESYYTNNNWGGPLFKVVFTYGKQTLEKRYMAKYASASYHYQNLENKEEMLVSDSSILIEASNHSAGYTNESFKFAISSDEIDLSGDNSMAFDFSYLELKKNAINGISFPSYNSSMALADMHGHFLDEVKSQGVVYFPGSYSLKSSFLRFNHTPTYYIDPNTRIIYKNNIPGRILTKKLYFPINAYAIKESSEYKDFPSYLISSSTFGFSKTEIKSMIGIYISNTSLIGACYSSGYCITSTDSRSDID